jgi:2,4-dienoyl-CoA reductase (NADPH2)
MAAFYAERARGGVALMITGGVSPNPEGRVAEGAAELSSESHVEAHRRVVTAVHENGGKIALQILHAGRYAFHERLVAPSPIQAPINFIRPRELDDAGILRTIEDFVRCAQLARSAGYDGVEIMGSEGYLINQFTVPLTNHRSDRWGGSFENRVRLPTEIVRGIRAAVGSDFLIVYRLSMLDLVSEGNPWEEIVELGKRIEEAGADSINTGIGWHEARIPTIAAMVPRAAFTWITRKFRAAVSLPLITSNRINMPETAEAVLARGDADLVSMARPFLADPEFVAKAEQGRSDEINTCIACNQACLDHIFQGKIATCLVNPRACRETEMTLIPADPKRSLAVVGAGPAGLTFAMVAASRGHRVVLFEKAGNIGGQLNMAVRIPGKEEFHETLRYYRRQLEIHGVEVKTGHSMDAEKIRREGFDAVVVATGVEPRIPDIQGIDHPKVVTYLDVLSRGATVGERAALIGAGGIGFDVAAFLTHIRAPESRTSGDIEAFLREWGVDRSYRGRGGLHPDGPLAPAPARQVYLLQRKDTKMGKGLGKTTGWIHRAILKRRAVRMISGVVYEKIDDRGLHIRRKGRRELLPVDTVVICAGQESQRELHEELVAAGIEVHLIGGAGEALELDAQRAIEEGWLLGAKI